MSTYGKLTVPTADVFKSQNNIASIDDNGKLLSSQLPSDVLTSTSLANSDLKVKSLEINSVDGHGILQGRDLMLDIVGDTDGLSLRSTQNNQTVGSIVLGAQEGKINGNIVIHSAYNTGYEAGEINISSSDGNYISLGDGKFALRSVFTTTNEGSEINLTQNDIKVIGAITTTIANNTNGEQITVGSDGITLDSKNRTPISLKNAASINIASVDSGSITLSDYAMNLSSSQIALTAEDSGGIVLNGYSNAKLDLSNGQVSLSLNNNAALTFSSSMPVNLHGGSGLPWLQFMSNGSIDLASEEGVGRIMITRSSTTTFENNTFQFKPCFGVTDPVYIKVPVVDAVENKLNGKYARVYVSENSSGTLELKVEEDS